MARQITASAGFLLTLALLALPREAAQRPPRHSGPLAGRVAVGSGTASAPQTPRAPHSPADSLVLLAAFHGDQPNRPQSEVPRRLPATDPIGPIRVPAEMPGRQERSATANWLGYPATAHPTFPVQILATPPALPAVQSMAVDLSRYLGRTVPVPEAEGLPPPEGIPGQIPLERDANSPPVPIHVAGGPASAAGDPSLDAVVVQAESLVRRAFSLAEKGALYSARAEFLQAIQAISKALDARYGQPAHSRTLAEALQAIREADDFASKDTAAVAAAGLDVAALVRSHRTPVLKSHDCSTTPAVVAMQHYYRYAQQQLVRAAGGIPAASQALYGVGKVYMALADQSSTWERLHGPKAMAFHQAAQLADPNNYLAANELGALLARFGRLREARDVLQYCVMVHPVPDAWHNLAVVHERLGEFDLAGLARGELWRAQQGSPLPSSPAGGAAASFVQWVDPATFSGAVPEAIPPAATPAARAANKPHRFWIW